MGLKVTAQKGGGAQNSELIYLVVEVGGVFVVLSTFLWLGECTDRC